MTESQIEMLLRRAPKITPPAGLLAQLQGEIRLPRANDPPLNAWFKRWIPALSFGAFVLGCLVVLAIQTSELSALRREAERLRQNATVQPSNGVALADVLEGLRKDQQEVEKLRAEIAQLRQALALIPELQAQTDSLRDQLRLQKAAVLANSDDPFAAAQEKGNSIKCVSNMKQIGLALRVWANDNQDNFPPDFLSITNELNTPTPLVCPSDTIKLPVERSWERFDPSRISYDYFGAGQNEAAGPGWVLTRCRFHGHVGLFDGSAHMNLGKRFRVVPEDGKYKFVRE